MVVCSFEMRGEVAADLSGDVRYRYAGGGAPADAPTAPMRDVGAGGELAQGPLFDGSRRLDGDDARHASARTLLAGWLASPPLHDRGLGGLQDALDRDGPAAVRRLRGDFVLAHLAADGSVLRLYRGPTSMIPLFWRAADGVLSWSTDPIHLLDGDAPRPSDVAHELVAMIIAERGFPHDRSWFTGVDRVPAGSCVTLRRGARPTVARFDALTAAPVPPDGIEAAADGLRARLHQACGRAVGGGDGGVLMLSGGIDSAAVARELGGDATAGATAVHFTLDGFPGFAEDCAAARSVADACGLDFQAYDMGPHVVRGGDYADERSGTNLPQTHVPLQGTSATARIADERGARFVFSGILADQIFAHDWHRGLVDVAGWSILNPLVTGEPPWQIARRTVGGSFDGAASPGARGYLRYLRALLRGDPAVALPSRDAIVHPVGFSDEAAARVTTALRDAANRARDELSDDGRRRGRIPVGTTSLFQINETFNTPNVQAAILNHFLPRRTFFFTPYADRDVIEYALSLPNALRIGLGHGATIDKLALRLAYAGDGMPAGIGRRMQQARIDAFPAVYVNQNFDRCRALLGEDSLLREAGVLSDAFARGLARQSIHRNGEEIVRMCVVESWLRKIAA